MKPASALKIAVSLAALDTVGATTTLETKLYALGPVVGSTLEGDLFIVGGGDPTLSGRLHHNNPHAIFQQWAADLRKAGIRHVEGRVIGDDELFDDVLTAPGWEQTDVTRWYAGRVSALSFNDNVVNILWWPGKEPGSPARVELDPPCRFFSIDNRVTTLADRNDGRFAYQYTDQPGRIRASGSIGLKSPQRREALAVPAPTWWAAASLAEVLAREGIACEQGPYDLDDVDIATLQQGPLRLISTHQSPPISELIRLMNQSSLNLFAELLLKQVGVAVHQEGSFPASTAAVRRVLAQRGVDPQGLAGMVDGSGLSHDNRVTPRALAQILLAGHDVPAFYNSLPDPSDKKAAIRHYLGESKTKQELRSRIRGKTGFIRGVRSLVGYVDHDNGAYMAFAILVNNLPNTQGAGKATVDNILAELARFPLPKPQNAVIAPEDLEATAEGDNNSN